MNILILGSEGLIGAPLGEHLSKQGHIVTGMDIKKSSILEDLRTPTGKKTLFDLINEKQIDKIIFLAFQVGGSKFLKEQDKTTDYILDNTLILANTFEVLKQTKVPFLFASTQMSNMLTTNYGFLKNLGERFTRSLGDQGRICRFWNVFGKEHNTDTTKNHVITDFINMAINTKEIKCRSSGQESRQFLHTSDCATAIETWVDGKWEDPSLYYDITSFEWVKIRDIATTIAKLTEAIVSHGVEQDMQTRYNEPVPVILDYWKPKLTLEQGIAMVMP